MSVNTPPGQGCGHELRPGAQFCTVCGSRAAVEDRRPPVDEEQMPAPAPQLAVPSGAYRESSAPAYPPGQGCGHELRLETQFCTVCGSRAADNGREIAPVAEVPAPGPEVTAIRPAPAQPEPVNPNSPATVTNWPQEGPSDDGVGPGPQRGWPDPSPALLGTMPAPGGTTPRQGRRHRSRWPLVIGVIALLAAGGAAAAFIVQPFHHSQAAANAPKTSPPATRQSLSASATAAPSQHCRPSQPLPHPHRNPRNRRQRASPRFSRRVSQTAVPP